MRLSWVKNTTQNVEKGVDIPPYVWYYNINKGTGNTNKEEAEMKIREIRKEFKERIRFAEAVIPELVDYHKSMLRTFEELWKNGTTTNFDNDFLRFANGYQINTGDYEGLHIMQTLDLHRITASKKTVEEMATAFFR